MRARTRLISTPRSRECAMSKQWIRPRQPTIAPNPQDRDEAAEVEFTFDGRALHVTGCQPLRT